MFSKYNQSIKKKLQKLQRKKKGSLKKQYNVNNTEIHNDII